MIGYTLVDSEATANSLNLIMKVVFLFEVIFLWLFITNLLITWLLALLASSLLVFIKFPSRGHILFCRSSILYWRSVHYRWDWGIFRCIVYVSNYINSFFWSTFNYDIVSIRSIFQIINIWGFWRPRSRKWDRKNIWYTLTLHFLPKIFPYY